MYSFRIRIANVHCQRIGHLALEPACLLIEDFLHFKDSKKTIICSHHKIANNALYRYWGSHFTVIESKIFSFLLKSMSSFFIFERNVHHYALSNNSERFAYRLFSKYESNFSKPVLLLNKRDEQSFSDGILEKIGVPKGRWFVCIHNREGGYSKIDEPIQSFRNCSIENFYSAIDRIRNAGGVVVRIGDASMTPLLKMDDVVDYAHHPNKSDEIDIILAAKSRFLVGNTSGIAILYSIFGTPCVITNCIPIATSWLSKKDIYVPKIIWSKDKNRILTFSEVLGGEVANFSNTQNYIAHNLIPLENSEDEILGAVDEMLRQNSGCKFITTSERKRLEKFDSLIKCAHYGYLSKSRISSYFLNKYNHLL